MGVTWYVLPIIREPRALASGIRQMMPWVADEIERSGLPAWLSELYAQVSENVESRYPTPNEIRRMLASLAGLRYSVGTSLRLSEPIPGILFESWRQAAVFTYVDDLDPHSFIEIHGFTGNEEEAQPLDGVPIVVQPDYSPDRLVRDWQRRHNGG